MRNILLLRALKANPPYSSAFFSTSKFPVSSSTSDALANFSADNDDPNDDLNLVRRSSFTATNPAVSPSILQPRVVIFDGVCRLCHTGVKWIIRADKYWKIKFCCLQSKTAEPYMELCGVKREDVLRRFIFIEGLGQYHQASTAALKVLSYLPFPYSTLSSLSVIPTPVRDAVYDYVAKRRYDLCGKEKECLVLKEPELLERFIDREELLERYHPDV